MKLFILFFMAMAVEVNGTKIKFLKYVTNSTRYAHIENSFENLDNGDVIFNSTIEFFQVVLKELHSVSVKLSKSDEDLNYGIELLKTRIDSCRVNDGVLNSIFMKVFMENFSNSSNYDFKCPFKKGIHRMTDLKVTTNFLPPFPRAMIPSGRAGFYVKDFLFGKIAGQKKLVHLYTWELYGKFYDE